MQILLFALIVLMSHGEALMKSFSGQKVFGKTSDKVFSFPDMLCPNPQVKEIADSCLKSTRGTSTFYKNSTLGSQITGEMHCERITSSDGTSAAGVGIIMTDKKEGFFSIGLSINPVVEQSRYHVYVNLEIEIPDDAQAYLNYEVEGRNVNIFLMVDESSTLGPPSPLLCPSYYLVIEMPSTEHARCLGFRELKNDYNHYNNGTVQEIEIVGLAACP